MRGASRVDARTGTHTLPYPRFKDVCASRREFSAPVCVPRIRRPGTHVREQQAYALLYKVARDRRIRTAGRVCSTDARAEEACRREQQQRRIRCFLARPRENPSFSMTSRPPTAFVFYHLRCRTLPRTPCWVLLQTFCVLRISCNRWNCDYLVDQEISFSCLVRDTGATRSLASFIGMFNIVSSSTNGTCREVRIPDKPSTIYFEIIYSKFVIDSPRIRRQVIS